MIMMCMSNRVNKLIVFYKSWGLKTIWSKSPNSKYRKVASSRLSRLLAHFQTVYKGEFWCLCTVTFGRNGPKMNSRPVYCSRLYSTYRVTRPNTRYSNAQYWWLTEVSALQSSTIIVHIGISANNMWVMTKTHTQRASKGKPLAPYTCSKYRWAQNSTNVDTLMHNIDGLPKWVRRRAAPSYISGYWPITWGWWQRRIPGQVPNSATTRNR